MIYATVNMSVGDYACTCDKKIVLYRGDKNVEIRFVIKGNRFTVLNSTYAQLIIKRPSAMSIFSEPALIQNDVVILTISEEMIDELKEIGEYTFQIRLYDTDMNARATLPPCNSCLIIERPIAVEGESAVNLAVVNDSAVMHAEPTSEDEIFTEDDEYNKTIWVDGDLITDARLNKIEDALFYINKKGGSGGGGATAPYISTELAETVLVGTGENFDLHLDFSSPNMGKGTLRVFVNDADVMSVRIDQGETITPIASDLFIKGTNRVVIYVLDRVGLMSNSLTFYIRYGSTELVSDFDIYSAYGYGEVIRYYFTPTALDTSLKLTFYMKIDGELQQGVECFSDTRGYFTFPSNLSPDNHYCEAYVLDSNGVKSNTIAFNLIILGENSLVVASDTMIASIEEGEQLVLDYKVYMNNNNSFITKTYVDGDLINTGTCGLDFNYYRTSSLPEGNHEIKIEVWDLTETYSDYVLWNVEITPSTFAMLEPVNAGAIFIASAVNKSNSDERRDEFIGKDEEGNEIVGELYNFSFDSDSGWVNDELIISGNSHVEIPIQPLANNARYGFTLDVEFTSRQIGADGAEVLTLWDDEKNCGIKITTEDLILRSAEGNECNLYFTDDERTNVMFIIDRNERKAKIYINGVMCEAFHLSDYSIEGVTYLEDFTVNSNLVLGGLNKPGYSKIRNLRVYNIALTTNEIINNWISCEIEKGKQRELVEFQKGDDLPTLYIYCDFSGLGKDDKKPCKIVYNSTDEEKYGKSFNLDHKQSTCQYQGTSSMAYPIKNYRINLADAKGNKWKYDFPGGQPEHRFTLKADFMNSCHAHNTGMAKFINDNLYNYNLTDEKSMNPFKWHHIQNGGDINDFREAINGFPCRLILVNDGETPLNEGQNEPTPGNTKDMGIFNFNHDKDATTTLGFDSDIFPNCASYEVTANSDTSAGAFMSWKSSPNTVDYYEFSSEYPYATTRMLIDINGFRTVTFDTPEVVRLNLYSEAKGWDTHLNVNMGKTYELPETSYYMEVLFKNQPSSIIINGVNYMMGDLVQNSFKEPYYKYQEGDDVKELDYIKQSFELRYPDEDDVPEGWGFMGVEEDKPCIDVYLSWGRYITTNFSVSYFETNEFTFSPNTGHVVEVATPNKSYWVPLPSPLILNEEDSFRLVLSASCDYITINGVDYYVNLIEENMSEFPYKDPYMKPVFINSSSLKALIDWVDNCTDEEFVRDFEQHFHKDYTLRYYALVVLIGAVDNLGKNMMLDTADNKIFFPRFYDIDTILSYDNSGDITFDVDIEMEQGYWNTSSSRLWTRIRELMHDDVVMIYNNMRQNGVSYEKIMSYMYGEQISKIPQTYYNKDYDVKYAPFEDSYIGMAHGDGYEHMKRWLKNRFIFCDTLFDYAPSYNNDMLTIRANTTEPMTIYIETYTPVYQHMSWYNGQMDKKKIDGKIAVEFTGTAMAATDQEVLIYGGSNIKSIKGISSMNPNQMLIGSATRLIELDVSNSPLLEDINSNKANLSPHSYLTKLNISNCPLLGGNLRINNSNLIQEINASGTAISGVIFPSKMKNLLKVNFANCANLVSLDLRAWDTSNVTDMSAMFNGCSSLTSIDLSGWDTSNVTNMYYMFGNCTKLTSLDLSGFDTGNVTSMSGMFSGCSDLTSLDLSDWDTSEVTNMSAMFSGCTKLTSLDVSGWDTSEVTSMYYMFYNCSRLTSLDLSGFDTGNVTDIHDMFSGCSGLTSLDVSGFDTGKVTNMGGMFYNCSRLTSLDVSGWDTSKVTIMYGMFQICSRLTSLDVSKFDTSNVTDMHHMFYNCSGLTSLDVSGFDTGNVTSTGSMFSGCSGLTSIDLSGFDTSKVTTMDYMFQNCNSLTSLDVSGFDTSKVTSMYYMFQNCNNLSSIDLSGFDTSNVTDMNAMFYGCNKLTYLDVSGFDTSKVTNMAYMFRDCNSLTSLDVSGFDMSNVNATASMFNGSNNLKILNANNCTISTLTKISEQLPTKTETSYGYLGASEVTEELTTSLLSKYWKLVNGLIVASYQATDEAYTPTFNSEITQHLTNLIADGLYSHIIALPENFTSCSFNGGSAVTAIDYLRVTSKVTNMDGMFYGCRGLTSLDVSRFDTSKVTSMYGMFNGCSGLTSLDVNGWDTSKVTDMAYMFYDCIGLTSLDVSGFDTSEVINMISMFNGCIGLTSLDLSGFDTSNVTTMGSMFQNCSGLTSLDVIGFDTSKVTSMTNMFRGCSGLTSLDVSGFDTRDVANMNNMFLGCSGLTSLDVNGWDTSEVINMISMFQNCNSLTSLDLSGFDISNVTNMAYMFRGCSGLTSLDLSGFDTSNITNMAYMFDGCNNLKILNANNCTIDALTKMSGQLPTKTETSYGYLGASEVTDELTMSLLSKYWKLVNGLIVASYQATDNNFAPTFNSGYTFSKDIYEISDGLYNVTLVSLEDFTSCSFNGGSAVTAIDYLRVTSKVADMASMFRGCSSLSSIDLSGFDTGNVVYMNNMFNGCSGLTSLDLSGFDTSKVMGMVYMFSGCTNLTSIDLSGFNTGKITNMIYMFHGCSGLTSLDLSGWDTSEVDNMGDMFNGCSGLTSIDLSGLDTSKVTNMGAMFAGCSQLTSLDLSGWDTGNIDNMNNMFYNCKQLTSLDLSGFDTGNVTRMSSMFRGCSGLTSLDVSGWDTGNVTIMDSMFRDCIGLTSLDLSGWDTSNVTDMHDMFYSCSGLTSLDLSGFDTGNVTHMSSMFNNCKQLTSLDVRGWDTSKVANMGYMFQICSGLTSLDLSGFDTSEVTSMEYMFNGCSGLTSLDLSGFDTGNVTRMSSMFQNCNSLTSLDISGWDTSKVTDMNNIFNNCRGLTSLDVSGLDTSKVTDMRYMFQNCISLTSLDVSGLDTSEVTNMNGMFNGCSGLTSLDVSGLDTGNVINIASMFAGCSGLTSLDLSELDTSKVTNMVYMFYGCSGLTSLDLSELDTGNVTNMDCMFYACNKLTSLDLSGFDTGNVTVMSNMFYNCNSLTSLDVSGFDTSKVTTMASMFNNCSGLTSLDVSGLDTREVTVMSAVFNNCSNLTSLDVSGFDTGKVTNMGDMFRGCSGLTSLDLSGFDTSDVTNMSNMFNNCRGLTSLDLSMFDTSNVTNMSNMFLGCSGLTSLDSMSNISTNLDLSPTVLNITSLLDVIDNLTTFQSQAFRTLRLGSILLAKITEDQIAIAVNKGWTVA